MQYIPILGLSGINTHVSPLVAADGELSDTVNFSSKKVGALTKTGDYLLKNAQVAANQNILGGIDFFRADLLNHLHVIAVDGAVNADIYIDVGGVWTAQSQSLTAGRRVRFAYSPTLDTLFAVNKADATRSFNGSAWSTSTNVTGAPKGDDIISFGRRIYILNAVVGSTAYPTRAYRSSLVDSVSITWDTTNDWITFDDVIVGAGKNGDNMFVGCANSIYLFTLSDEKYPVSTKGCVSRESIASYKQWTFWASYDGMYAFNGSDDINISLPIKEWWDGLSLSNLQNIRAEIHGDYLYVYVGSITSPRAASNVLWEYDINQNDWNRIELGVDCQNLHTYVNASGKQLFMGDDNGKVYQMFTSGAQDGNPFQSSVETNWIYGAAHNQESDFTELWGYGNKLSGIQVMYKLNSDDEKWKAAENLTGNISVSKFKARGYRIKFKLTETSKGNLYDIDGLEVGYEDQYTGQENPEKQ